MDSIASFLKLQLPLISSLVMVEASSGYLSPPLYSLLQTLSDAAFCCSVVKVLCALCSHPHVIRFRECFLTTKHLAIVMEYVAGGNLHQLVNSWGGLPEALARWFFQQLIVALDYCHKVCALPPRALLQLVRN